MTNESDVKGRAFEYACIHALLDAISEHRSVSIIKDRVYNHCLDSWNMIPVAEKSVNQLAAISAIPTIFELEPMMIEQTEGSLVLSIQSDAKGKTGDVRDILVSREDVKWEIGFSLKHNHFAVKHSRLSSHLDFCNSWFGIPCTKEYWNDVRPIFDRLKILKDNKIKWNQMTDKAESVYIPILNAFRQEIIRQYSSHGSIVPIRMVEYLLGEFDFYKVISVESKRFTTIEPFNLKGTLNQESNKAKPVRLIDQLVLPSKILAIEMKNKSNNTIEMYLDGGWSFSFRIHNASTMVEPSLKFDVQFLGLPANIVSINCIWA